MENAEKNGSKEITIKYEEIFNFWYKNRDVQIVSKWITDKFTQHLNDEQLLKIKRKVATFCSHLKIKWEKHHRSLNRMKTKESNWLSHELEFNIFGDAKTAIPTRQISSSNVPVPMSPEEALVFLLKNGFTKRQYTNTRELNRKHNCDIYPSYKKVMEYKMQCRPEKLKELENLTKLYLQNDDGESSNATNCSKEFKIKYEEIFDFWRKNRDAKITFKWITDKFTHLNNDHLKTKWAKHDRSVERMKTREKNWLSRELLLNSFEDAKTSRKITVSNHPVHMSPEEALFFVLKNGFTKTQYISICELHKTQNCDIFPSYRKVMEFKMRCRPEKLEELENLAKLYLQNDDGASSDE